MAYISWSSDLANILKTIQWLNIILWDYGSVWPDMWPPNICRSLWPVFHGLLNLPFILKTVWTPYFWIMSQYDTTFDLKINVGHCDLYFMVQYFALYFEDCLIYEHHTLGLWVSMTQHQYDLKINVGPCRSYFMIQWFYLISWRLFDIWPPCLGIMSQYDPMFDLKIFVAYCGLYFMV